MKICVLKASYTGSGQILEDLDPNECCPGDFTDQHTFHDRWIHKATAKEEIDAAVAEGFDLYFNFLWGQREDNVAGIDAVRYLESKGVPFMGMPSRILERSKLDLYRDAPKMGVRVPETTRYPKKFPVIVKPAKCCSGMHMDENSVCHNAEELEAQVAILNERLKPGREIAGDSVNGNEGEDDIVVQEFIDGQDYSVVIVEMMNTPIALDPTRFWYPEGLSGKKGTIMTMEIKFHPELKEELLKRADNPELYDTLQDLAVKMWKANKMEGGNWGNVDIRVRHSDGEAVGIEVNPMPAVFERQHKQKDIDIAEFPGGHRLFIDILIESTLSRHNPKSSIVSKQVESWNIFAPTYNDGLNSDDGGSCLLRVYDQLQQAFDFSGIILDVACGTGAFPLKLRETMANKQSPSSSSSSSSASSPENPTAPGDRIFHGIDLSPEMLRVAQSTTSGPLYEKTYTGLMQDVLPTLTQNYDHVICMSSLYYLSPTQLSVVLARMFQLAKFSVTFSIEKVPEEYQQILRKAGKEHMVGCNHIETLKGFRAPKGWRAVDCTMFEMFWISKHTGQKVYSDIFRFERV